MKIPQGTHNGQKFRLREKGVANSRTGKRGDQIVEVQVLAPVVQDERTKELLREYAQIHPGGSARRQSGRRYRTDESMGKRGKAYMISSVAEQYQIHPQTLRLYEREGLLKPSRSDGNTRLYTDQDLERLDVILKLTRDLGVNLAGVEIILNMREKMEEMQRQIQEFVASLNTEISQRPRPAPQPLNSLIPVIEMPPSEEVGDVASTSVFRMGRYRHGEIGGHKPTIQTKPVTSQADRRRMPHQPLNLFNRQAWRLFHARRLLWKANSYESSDTVREAGQIHA